MYVSCWLGQGREMKNLALGASLSTLAPIGKHDVYHHVFGWSTPLVLCFFVPIDRASSCLFTIFASAKVSLGAYEVILPHSGNVCCASQ